MMRRYIERESEAPEDQTLGSRQVHFFPAPNPGEHRPHVAHEVRMEDSYEHRARKRCWVKEKANIIHLEAVLEMDKTLGAVAVGAGSC